jgi:hypothetical protein
MGNNQQPAYITKRCTGKNTTQVKTCAVCVPCPRGKPFNEQCVAGLPNQDCTMDYGTASSEIATSFNNVTDIRRVFTMSVTNTFPRGWFSTYGDSSFMEDLFMRHFRNKFILSHRIPEVQRIVFEIPLSHDNLAFWTSYANIEDAKLAEKTFDMNKFNAFSDNTPFLSTQDTYTGTLKSNDPKFVSLSNVVASTPQQGTRVLVMTLTYMGNVTSVQVILTKIAIVLAIDTNHVKLITTTNSRRRLLAIPTIFKSIFHIVVTNATDASSLLDNAHSNEDKLKQLLNELGIQVLEFSAELSNVLAHTDPVTSTTPVQDNTESIAGSITPTFCVYLAGFVALVISLMY